MDAQPKFRLVYPDDPYVKMKYGPSWYCTACDIVPKTEHNKEECNRCRDWSGCGNDCKLSKLECPNCGAVQTF